MVADGDRHLREIERLHEGMVVELDRRFTPRNERAGLVTRGRGESDVDAEVASTISVVRQVAELLADLQETIRRQEELLLEQRQTIADLQHEKQGAFADLADAERAVRAEAERAVRAETRAQSGEAQIRRLEDYSVSLKSHLNSLMGVVRESLAVEPTKAPLHGSNSA